MSPAIPDLALAAVEGVMDLPGEVMYHLLYHTGLPQWSAYPIWWFLAGLTGVVIFRFIAEGPANPFGNEEEQKAFWFIFIAGPFSLGFAGYAAYQNVDKGLISATLFVARPERMYWSRFGKRDAK
jgi:hypothetical protein